MKEQVYLDSEGNPVIRKFAREEIRILVTVLTGENIDMRGIILSTNDISPDGVFIDTREKVSKGSKVFVKFVLPSGRRGVSPGSVVRVEPGGFAVEFDHSCPLILEELGQYPRFSKHQKSVAS